jgi:heme-degrading monooxygenase HmoA
MHARMTRFEAAPEQLDDMAAHFEQHSLPTVQGLDGFEGYTLLGDRSGGSAIAITYWASEDALQASEEVGQQARQQAAQAAGVQTAASVERFEVLRRQ